MGQRGWHPTGKVLGNVVGGVIGKLRGENMMQNGPDGQEKRRDAARFGDCGASIEPECLTRRGSNINEMQNGGEAEEERRGSNINEMQNGGEAEEERRVEGLCLGPGECGGKRSSWNNPIQMQEEEGEEERRGSNINEMQNGGEAEEERRGSNINEMQNGGEAEE